MKRPAKSTRRSTKRRAPPRAARVQREFERQGVLEPGEAVADVGCPDCRGVLAVSERGHEGWLVFRCRIGHAFAADSLAIAKAAQIEQSLESALAGLGELAQLYTALHERFPVGASRGRAPPFDRQARDARRRIEVIEALLDRGRTARAGRKPNG